jgi:hypothetical protein
MASFVRFDRTFYFSPVGARWGRRYEPGWTILVPETHAVAAVIAGAGRRVPRNQVDRNDPHTVTRNGRHRSSSRSH